MTCPGEGWSILDERRAEILALLQETPGYVTVEQLMERLNVSRRTVYYDMKKIDEWLRDNGLEPVEHVRWLGFRLPEASRAGLPEITKRIRRYEYVLSPKERKAWMAILLFTRPDAVHVQDLADFLQTSRMTALQDMKQLKKEFELFGLKVDAERRAGYVVEGKESDKRKALAHYLSQTIDDAGWKRFNMLMRGALPNPYANRQFSQLMSEERQEALQRLVADCERSLGLEFTDEMIITLSTRLLLFANRLKQGERVRMDEDEKAILKRMPEYRGAKQLAEGLAEMFQVEFPEDEICYLTVHLLGARLNRLDPTGSGDGEKPSEETKAIRELTSRIVDRFERLACMFFEQRETLEEQLFLHLKPAYYRIKYGLEAEHPMLDTMRTKYRELFELTRKAIEPLEEKLGRRVNDDEVAYVAMHFGGWMRRQNAAPVRRRRAAIVCVNGVSTSRMLRVQLEGLFPYLDIVSVMSLREYERFRQPIDVWFSTVPLPRTKEPVFVVNPVLSDREKAHLLHEVNRRLEMDRAGAANPVGGLIDLIKRYADVKDEDGLAEALTGYWSSAQKRDYAEPERPSLSELLPPSRIRIAGESPDWERAIELAAQPLLGDGLIEPRYVEAMVDKVRRLGPYIVIAPGVAIAHAKPEEGVIATGMSLLVVQGGIAFSRDEKHRVKALFALASDDSESHLLAIRQLTMLLRDENNRRRLAEATDAEQLAALLRKAGEADEG
jgi:mannitol operon transcriptional antiterminator